MAVHVCVSLLLERVLTCLLQHELVVLVLLMVRLTLSFWARPGQGHSSAIVYGVFCDEGHWVC